ncbi:MAG: hypothetical protein ABI972_04800 [Acidobacteriota bacterium]
MCGNDYDSGVLGGSYWRVIPGVGFAVAAIVVDDIGRFMLRPLEWIELAISPNR